MTTTYTAFQGHAQIAAGSLRAVALAAHAAGVGSTLLVLQDQTGRVVDLDLRGSTEDVILHLVDHPLEPKVAAPPVVIDGPPRRGRPRLGVVSREISLLPRHWDWLARQPRSASASLRTLVEARIKEGQQRDRRKAQDEAAWRAMSSLAGDLPGFEEASRALFAHDAARLRECVAGWPSDVAGYVARLAALPA